jgi:two-component system sensor histidine kinase KdpD
VFASVLLNYYFIPPIHRFTIADPNNLLALAVFAAVALTVAAVVDRAARLARRAARATAEAETLSALAGSVLGGQSAIEALLARLRETFGMESVALMHRHLQDGPDHEQAPEREEVAHVGPRQIPASEAQSDPTSPSEVQAVEEVPVGENAVLVLRGRPLPAADRRVLTAFAAHVAAALDRAHLAEVAAEIEPVKAADRMRTALLAAVSHDLRTPLAVAMASVSSLRSQDVTFTPQDQQELLAGAEEALAKLNRLVDNLLDMSRLQAGALPLDLRPTALGDVLSAAVSSLTESQPPDLRLQGLDATPPVLADGPLLERVVANLLANALRQSACQSVLVAASVLGDRVQVRVVDHGPGLPAEDWQRVFLPFQRLGDTDNETGVGLGLALARGLAEAMGGTLTPEDTPGGGLTMVLTLPLDPQPTDRDSGTRPAAESVPAAQLPTSQGDPRS